MYFFSPLFILNTFAALTKDHEWKTFLRRTLSYGFYSSYQFDMQFNILASLQFYYIYAKAESFGGVKQIEGVENVADNQLTKKIVDWESKLTDFLEMLFNQFNPENICLILKNNQSRMSEILDDESLEDEEILAHFAKLFKPVLQLWDNKKDLKSTCDECRNELKKLEEGSDTRRTLLEKLSGLGLLAYEDKSSPGERLAKLIYHLSGRSKNSS